MKEFSYLRVFFISEGKMERKMNKRIGAASGVLRTLDLAVIRMPPGRLPLEVSRYVQLVGVLRVDPELAGRIIYLTLPGNVSGSLWKTLLGRCKPHQLSH